MAEYLIRDTTLAAIGDAIRTKEESSGAIPVSEIASRIVAIDTGVTVQRESGTFTTDSSGNATVTCGFKPDLVVLHRSEGSNSGTDSYSCAAAFTEDTRRSIINLALWSKTVEFYDIKVYQTNTGFSFESIGYELDWTETIAKTTFSYIAVKYTE